MNGFGENNTLLETKSVDKISDVTSSGESQVSRSSHRKVGESNSTERLGTLSNLESVALSPKQH